MNSIEIMNGCTIAGLLFALGLIVSAIGLIIIDVNLIKGTLRHRDHQNSTLGN